MEGRRLEVERTGGGKKSRKNLEKGQNGAELLTGWRSEIFKCSRSSVLKQEKCKGRDGGGEKIT